MTIVLGLFVATAGLLLLIIDESKTWINQLLTLGGGCCMFYVGLKMMGVI